MLKIDWCNIIFKDEWIPNDAVLDVYGTKMTKEEYMIETNGLNYWEKLQLLQPFFIDIEKDLVFFNSRSGAHYQNGFALGRDFFIHFDNECNSKGCFLEFPSHGLYHLYKWLDIDITAEDSFEVLCKKLWYLGCRFSRIDICKDIKKEGCIFTPAYLEKLFLSNRIVTRLTNRDLSVSAALPVSDVKVPDMRYISAGSNGSTFYLGSLSNRRKILRVYDKEAESMNKEKPFYRWEVELHAEYARSLMQKIVENWSVDFSDLIRQFMYVIVENNNTSNRCQVKRDPEWEDFVDLEFSEDIPSGINLNPDRHDKDRDKREAWARSCIPVMASILWSSRNSSDRRLMLDLCEDLDKMDYWCKDNGREDLLKELKYYLRKNYLFQ